MTARHRAFVAVAPGLEPWLRDELVDLGWARDDLDVLEGGVELRDELPALERIVWRSRLAEAVRVRIASFDAHDFSTLESRAARVAWHAWLRRDDRVEVRASARKSRLIHTGAIAQRVAEAISTRRGCTIVRDAAEAEQRVYVRNERDRVQVSVSMHGAARLHRRGWRTHVGSAPLRETLAAALVRVADASASVCDPFCGSGTIPIEAALAAAGVAPGTGRSFAFQQWPVHDAEAWAAATEADERVEAKFTASGYDKDTDAVAAARANARHAGVACEFDVRDAVSTVEALPPATAVVSNLPYGRRTPGGSGLASTFQRLGAALGARDDLGPVVVLNGHPGFAELTGCRWEQVATLTNRGVPVTVLRLERS